MNHYSSPGLFALLAILSSACAPARRSPADLPSVPGLPETPTPSLGPWTFAHAPGTRAYHISRNASIEGIADSASHREIVSNLTHQILTLEQGVEQITFKAVIDTFAVITQGIIGPPQSVILPVELTGSIGPGGVHIEDSPNGGCNAVRATAMTDLHNLLAPFPSSLSKGAVWRDSVTISGCQAGIQTKVETRRTFTLTGEVDYSGRRLLLVQRLDSINALGEGAYNQHRMKVESTGTGTARYYLDTMSGEVSQLTTSQQSWIKVTTSGRVHSFAQMANQAFVRVP